MNCNKCGRGMAFTEFVEKAGLCIECYLEDGRAIIKAVDGGGR